MLNLYMDKPNRARKTITLFCSIRILIWISAHSWLFLSSNVHSNIRKYHSFSVFKHWVLQWWEKWGRVSDASFVMNLPGQRAISFCISLHECHELANMAFCNIEKASGEWSQGWWPGTQVTKLLLKESIRNLLKGTYLGHHYRKPKIC